MPNRSSCWLRFLVGALTLFGWSEFVDAAELKGARPNIILVMTDDQGYGDLSCHGNPILKTPHLDQFYQQSVRFTDFMVSPTCAPTRSALMTGRHEFKNGVTHTIAERERLTLKATTIAQVLKSAGYATGIFGKWHLGDEPAYWPDKRGFDEVFIHGAGGIGQTYPGSCGDAPANSYFNPAILHNGQFVKTKGYCTDVFFEQALRWIEHKKGTGPFFAYITPNAPHAPLDCPPEYEKLYTGKVPANAAKFFGMIANIDDNFGKMTRALDRWELSRNTLVVFMTDNGGTVGVSTFNAGMRGSKVTPYLGGTRVPCFWRWPAGFQGGVDIPELTAHIDFFRTFAELAGAALSPEAELQAEGRSLLPLLRHPKGEWPERTLVTHVGRWEKGGARASRFHLCSIRNSQYQLVNPKKTEDAWELYDLKADPGQKNNIVESHPAIAAELRKSLERWWQATEPLLVNENAKGPALNPFKELYWKQFGGGPSPELKRQMDSNDPETRAKFGRLFD